MEKVFVYSIDLSSGTPRRSRRNVWPTTTGRVAEARMDGLDGLHPNRAVGDHLIYRMLVGIGRHRDHPDCSTTNRKSGNNFDNFNRPHGGLDDQTLYERLSKEPRQKM